MDKQEPRVIREAREIINESQIQPPDMSDWLAKYQRENPQQRSWRWQPQTEGDDRTIAEGQNKAFQEEVALKLKALSEAYLLAGEVVAAQNVRIIALEKGLKNLEATEARQKAESFGGRVLDLVVLWCLKILFVFQHVGNSRGGNG